MRPGRGTGRAAALALGLALAPPALAGEKLDHELGRALFDKLWVAAPASTGGSDGLGPFYNARSCAGCHPGTGRAPRPEAGPTPPGLVLHIGGAPSLGGQLQTHATNGLQAEAHVALSYEADGPLRRPFYLLDTPLPESAALSPRLAPKLAGLGALAAIPDAAILANADPDDADGDGISGRAALLPDGRLGRFGHKAREATLAEQTAAALRDDMGISSPLAAAPWGDCTEAQPACRTAPHGGTPEAPEISAEAFALLAAFVADVPAPAATPDTSEGAALFAAIGCTACHQPTLTPDGPRAFTDLLLHDLGPDLADPLAEGAAAPGEWRTAPLWGAGSATSFLHDGRARSLTEAILWHGGEALPSRQRFTLLAPGDRTRLIAYLESL